MVGFTNMKWSTVWWYAARHASAASEWFCGLTLSFPLGSPKNEWLEPEAKSSRNEKEDHASKLTIQGTNISPENGILQMIFLFPRWDMLVPWRVHLWVQHVHFRECKHPLSQLKTQGIQTAAWSMVWFLFAKNPWEPPRCFCWRRPPNPWSF